MHLLYPTDKTLHLDRIISNFEFL